MTNNMMNVLPNGTFYETEVPDTFDLAERAGWALEGMMNSVDPSMMSMYGLIRLTSREPKFCHWSADIPLDPKFGESLSMMRLMSGNRSFEELERDYRQEMLSRIDDGLYWDRFDVKRPWRKIYGNSAELYGEANDVDFSNVWGEARMIRALTTWSGIFDADVTELNRSMIDGLRRIAVDKDDYSYYPHRGGWNDGFVYPRSGWLDTTEAEKDREGPEGSVTCFQGHQIYSAAQWAMLTGDKTASELAERLSRYVMKPKFWGGTISPERDANKQIVIVPDAPFRDGSQTGQWPVHFHARAIPLRGLLYQAMNTGDERLLEFVKASYDFTMTQGIPRMGWINTFPPASGCEGCALGDLIGMAIRLTDAGAGDYWDDVDAIVRNQLAEQQITDTVAMAAFCASQPETVKREEYPEGFINTDDVVNRSKGTFLVDTNCTYANHPLAMHCCTANASQGLFYAWEGALREDIGGGSAVVNLLLNRAGRMLDVESYLPYEGKAVLKVKTSCRLSVRIPRWIDIGKVRIIMNGNDVPVERLSRYITIRNAAPGENYTILFLVTERTFEYTVNKNTPVEDSYRCVFRGSTLVEIAGGRTPEVYNLPIYQGRAGLRSDTAPMKKKTIFIADRSFGNW